ncbi:MAG: CehA/McbA family metallohydrolase [Deltaproteobacteria bacterium]|nr:CehA/McbA family metallohydrolase [Deltaproteobacteria bacterium]
MLLPALAVISSMHYEGDVAPTGGDFVDVPFEVPAGTVEIQIAHGDGSDSVILDWGVWDDTGAFRGWGGGNTEDAVIGVAESSRSYRTGPIAPGTWTLVIGKAKLDPTGGRYAVDVICRDDATLPVRPRAAFDPAVLAPGRRWYKGDFHVHSDESGDASATFDQIAALARMRGLDFVNLSDHNTDAQLGLAAAHQAGHPDLLFLRGAEITTYAGHGNAVGLPGYVDHRIGYRGRTIQAVLEDVAAQGLFIVNHPALDLGGNCIGCAWRHDATPWERVAGLEIITGRWDVVERLFTPQAIALWDAQLDAGHRIAAIGGSDDHRAGEGTGATDTPIGSPTTLVLADDLSEAAILDGLRRGRTIVQLRGPDDPFVELTLARPGGGIAELGDEVAGVARAELTVHVVNPRGETVFAQLWRDGEKLDQVPVEGADFTHTFADVPGAAPHRYRIELIDDANRRIVVTSHIFVDGVAASPEGCCSGSAGGTAPLAGLALAALLRRKRRP